MNFEEIGSKGDNSSKSSFNNWLGGGIGVSAHLDDDGKNDESIDFSKFRDDQEYEINKYM